MSTLRRRECLDCDHIFPPSEPAWRTRCRDCYSAHRNSLKMRACEVCGLREKRENWKKTCGGCYKKARLAEREAKAEKIERVSRKPAATQDQDLDLDSAFAEVW